MPSVMVDKDLAMARRIAGRVADAGGKVYYVGGYVRDLLMGKENKDIDIEVHGVTPSCLAGILDSLGKRMTIGESFGVFGLRGYSLDIAMPRKEKVRGYGHRDFDVFVDPFIGTRKAAMRRDFTINAMMQDVLTGELVDEFGGREDLTAGRIRHVSDETFAEDALRVLRAAQFAARFGFCVADETVELCRSMDLSHLPKERIMGELEKALLKAERPSVFFEELRRMDQLGTWFPELEALIGVPQDPVHHPEGDVWTHTMMVLDAAAKERDSAVDPIGLLLGALVHDMGKALTTQEGTDGRIHAYKHNDLGLPVAEQFLNRLTNETKRIRLALNLAELHMRPNIIARDRSSVKAANRMFDEALDPEALLILARADASLGRTQEEREEDDRFLQERLAVFREYMARPYVMGRDLIEAGLKPGIRFSEYLAYAHKLRLAGVDKESALKQTLSYARKEEKAAGGRSAAE